MRVLVLYAHPNPESFGAALHSATVDGLRRAGHEVDDCDLYGEGFDPVLSRDERVGYHDLARNQTNVEGYVQRVQRADALVLCYPVWNFGFPAILKGFFDRVFLPGVSFKLVDGRVQPALHNIRKLSAVTTYGGSRWRAVLMGDPPRKVVGRVLRVIVQPGAPFSYHAHYDMNRSTAESRAAFLAKVSAAMERF